MPNELYDLIDKLVTRLSDSGLTIDVHVKIGGDDAIETDYIVSDLGTQPAQHGETDLHFGFSSPAGQQYWDDDELKGKQ